MREQLQICLGRILPRLQTYKRGSNGADKPESEDVGPENGPENERPETVVESATIYVSGTGG